jgi:hypothetical protein
LALQAKIIGEIDSAEAACHSSIAKFQTANDLLANLKKQKETALAIYKLGEISKLEFLGVQLEMALSAQSRLDALIKAHQAIGQLEDAMQSPLNLKDWVFEVPQRQSRENKERNND